MSTPRRAARRGLSVLAAGVAALGLVQMTAPPAHADTVTVHNDTELGRALQQNCLPGGQTRQVVLAADFQTGWGQLCPSVSIDLRGHTLSGSLTTNSRALSFTDSAGGGGFDGDLQVSSDGALTIGGGSFAGFIAVSGRASLTVTGGSVVARGRPGEEFEDDRRGGSYIQPAFPGILLDGDSASLTVTGGSVTATGAAGVQDGTGSAAIGGFEGAAGGTVVITGGTVTASGPYTAIGAGSGAKGFGLLRVDGGTLRVPEGEMRVLDSNKGDEIVVGAEGTITGAATGSGQATWFGLPGLGSGAGSIGNQGVITVPAANLTDNGLLVRGRHYEVSFETDGGDDLDPVTVFAPSFDAAGLTLPTPTRGSDSFLGWRTAAVDGDVFDAESVLKDGSDDGTAEKVTLYAAWEVDAIPFESAPVVSVTGTAKVGETLTAAVTGGSPVASGTAKTYRWLRDGEPIDGATGDTYTLTPADRTHAISVEVTSSANGYEDDITTSKGTAEVDYGTFTTGAPTISGTEQVGQTLSCSSLKGSNASYEWFRGQTSVSETSTYEPVGADVGQRLTCVATVEREGYTDAKSKASTGVIAEGTFTIGDPTITGLEQVGQTLTCAAAAETPGEVSFAWLRGTTSVGTGSTYELVADDEDESVTCVATSKRYGYANASAGTDSGVVSAGSFAIGAPTISGTAQVGQTLTCAKAPGTIGAVSYTWNRGKDSTVLSSSSLYTPVPADVDRVLRCLVTSARDGYTDATAGAISEIVAPGAAGRYDVRVEGLRGPDGDAPRIRRPLTAELVAQPGSPVPTQVAWQWFADGEEIIGATTARFRPGVELLGADLSVAAYVAATGYEQTVATGRFARPVTVRALEFGFDRARVTGGERVGFTATNLVPGQDWTLVSLLDGAVLARGTVGDETETLTRTVLVPRRYAGGERAFAFRTTGPDRGVLDRLVVR